jgi:uncharacterized protein YciI
MPPPQKGERTMRPAAAALVVLGFVYAATPTFANAAEPAAAQPPAAAAAGSPPPAVKSPDEMAAKMTTYYMAFLRRGAPAAANAPASAELMKGHMANIQRLAKEGKLVLAGPFLAQTGPGSLAGLFILQAGSVAEAQQLVDTDPAVQAGRFTVEIVPWLGPKVLAKIPEMFDREP